jgi:hypothetical protein
MTPSQPASEEASMPRSARRVALALVLALSALIGAAQFVVAAPSITRAHYESLVRFDDCGIGTAWMSVDLLLMINEADNHTSYMTLYRGTVVDTSTGLTYQLVERSTQMFLTSASGSFVNVAEGTILLLGPDGGLVARGLNRTTINADGSVRDFSVHFSMCIQ